MIIFTMAHEFDQATMDWLKLWHLRMGYSSFEAIVTMGSGQATGMNLPDNLPSRSELGPYLERHHCVARLQVCGSASGPHPDQQ